LTNCGQPISGAYNETFEEVSQNQDADATFIFTLNAQEILPYEPLNAEVTNPVDGTVYLWTLNNLLVGTGY